ASYQRDLISEMHESPKVDNITLRFLIARPFSNFYLYGLATNRVSLLGNTISGLGFLTTFTICAAGAPKIGSATRTRRFYWRICAMRKRHASRSNLLPPGRKPRGMRCGQRSERESNQSEDGFCPKHRF